MADTSIRLWHVGPYRYGWEDAGKSHDRYADYTFSLPNGIGEPLPPPQPAKEEQSQGEFTEDWFGSNIPIIDRLLDPIKGKPVHALEIGVYEGRSTCWLLDNILTHPEASLTWIDSFVGSAEHADHDVSGVESRFRANIARFGSRVQGFVGRSQDILKALTGKFDLVYIDGSHEAADVLADAILAWPLLKPGGRLGFDDYGWHVFPEPERCPGPAVDAFLLTMRKRYEELYRGYQVWIRKTQ
jgi:predicted O-methyltransferase YrrM